MHQAASPRQFLSAQGLPGAGLPHDRVSRLAARQAFVELKATFIAAVDTVPGNQGDWLRRQVRSAEEPVDLWLLRAPVLESLSALDAVARLWRGRLRRGLEALFPDSEIASAFSSL